MRAIFMKYKVKKIPKKSKVSKINDVQCSPLVSLPNQNVFSTTPCPKNCDTAIAYSKGKLSNLPPISWN